MKKKDSEDWQEGMARMEEELRRAKEERDALRAVMKGDASPDALSSIDDVPIGKAPIRLMSGEEYRKWVQESVSRRLMKTFSAFGIGGFIALVSLIRIYLGGLEEDISLKVESRLRGQVEKQVERGVKEEVKDAAKEMEQNMKGQIEAKISATMLDESGINDEMRNQANKLQREISSVLESLIETKAGAAVDEMVQHAAEKKETIDSIIAAINTKGALDGVVVNQIVRTFNKNKGDEKLRIQALKMLDVFGGDKELQQIQKEVLLNSPPESEPEVRKEVLKVFRPWDDGKQNNEIRDHMLVEFSEDPKCNIKTENGDLFSARRDFLTTLGPEHAREIMKHLASRDIDHRPYCLVAEAFAEMQDADKEGLALKELLAMANSPDRYAPKVAWQNLGGITNVPNQAVRHEALRTAWKLLGAVEGLDDFKGEKASEIEKWLVKEKGGQSLYAQARRLFVNTLKVEDWESFVVSLWPKTEIAEKDARKSGSFSKNATRNPNEGLQRQVLAALIVDCIKSNEEQNLPLANHLIEHILDDPAYLSQKGLCRVVSFAMEHCSVEVLGQFMTSVSGHLTSGEPTPNHYQSAPHQVRLLAAALRRDTRLPEKKFDAAVHLINKVQEKKGDRDLLFTLFPAFLAAVDNESSLVEQIKQHLETEGEAGKVQSLRRYGLEMSRLLASRDDPKLVKAIEDQNLVGVLIGVIESEETDKELQELQSMAADIYKELVSTVGWVGRIPDTTALVPGETLSKLTKEESWFHLKLEADTEYRINLAGGSAELTLIGADKVMVLDRYLFEDGNWTYALPAGRHGGDRYLRLRPQKGNRSGSKWKIQTNKIPRLDMSHKDSDAPLIQPGHYADHFLGRNHEGGWISFKPSARSRYVIETSGETDTELELFNDDKMLLHRDDDGGEGKASKIQWIPFDDSILFARVRMKVEDFPGGSHPFEITLKEYESKQWEDSKVKTADQSAEKAPRLSPEELKKGLLVQVPPQDEKNASRGFLRLPVEQGQVVEMLSTSGVYLSDREVDFPRLSVKAATETDVMERSIWWVTEKTEYAAMNCSGNLFVKKKVILPDAGFSNSISDNDTTMILTESRQFISQNLTEGNSYLPIQGEPGKRYRFSFLGEEESGCEMAILLPNGDSQPIDEPWDPNKVDVIWEPAKEAIYYLRMNVTKGPARFLLQTHGEAASSGAGSKPFQGLQVGHRVTLGIENDKYSKPELAGSGAIILRLVNHPVDGELAILDSGYGTERAGNRFSWKVTNMKPSVKTVND